MKIWRIRNCSAVLAALAITLTTLTVAVPPVQAQSEAEVTPGDVGGVPADVAETCGDWGVLSVLEGPFGVVVESLRARGAPNPPGIEAALDVLLAEAEPALERPSSTELDAAVATLQGFFGEVCDDLDRCAFVAQISGGDPAASAEAARLLARIETPQPAGLSATLGFIAGDVEVAPVDNLEQAITEIVDEYQCGETDNGGQTTVLADTGATAAPLALLGAALVVSGAGVMHLRRRLLDS